MFGELAIFAVNRHEVTWPYEVQHQFQLFGARVPRNVDRGIHASVDEVGAAFGTWFDHAINRFLIAGDDAGAEDDGIAGLEDRLL